MPRVVRTGLIMSSILRGQKHQPGHDKRLQRYTWYAWSRMMLQRRSMLTLFKIDNIVRSVRQMGVEMVLLCAGGRTIVVA